MIPVPRKVIEALSSLYGCPSQALKHYGGGHNESDGVVYSYPTSEKTVLLKVIAIPVREKQRGVLCLEERLRFSRFLGKNGAPVVFPRLSPRGRHYETVSSDEHIWIGYSMDIAPGKTRKPHDCDAGFFRRWGASVGLMHRLSTGYPSWESSADPESGKHYLTWKEEWESFLAWCRDEDVKNEWRKIAGQLEQLPITREVYGFIHNDPHLWNLHDDGRHLTILDFDVANHHWFINDIAIACQSILFAQSGGMDKPVHHHDKLINFLTAFIEGYRSQYRILGEWLDRLDLFLSYRRILLFTAMYESIKRNGKNHESWKKMILSGERVIGKLSGLLG
ncbi:MAG: phosphotransferase enzyme family protein [Spirochaetia bacterium]